MKKRSTTHESNEIHRTAEQTQLSSASHLQQLFDEMTNGFALHEIICDKNGKPVDYRFLQLNAAFERQTGLVAGDILGKRALEVIPGLEPYWIETYGRVALTGQSERFENYTKALHKTFSVVAYSPQSGQFAVLFEDITERRQAEELLIRRNQDLDLSNAVNTALNNGESLEAVFNLISEKVKIIFNSFGSTVNLVNADQTHLVMQNLVIPDWLVKSIEKLTGINIPRIEHDLQTAHPYHTVFTTGRAQLINDPEGIQEFTKGYIHCLKAPEKTRNRLKKLIPSISKLTGRRSVMVVPLLSNNVIIGTLDIGSSEHYGEEDLLRLEAIAASLTTVILRKQADDELVANEEKYRSLFNSMSEGVAINELIMDEDGKVVDYIILDVNAAFEINTPFTAKDVLGKRATAIYQMSPEYITSWWQQHVEMGQTAYTELYNEPAQRWHAITTTRPVGKRFYTIFSDITGRKLAEQKLQESAGNLQAILDANLDAVFLIEPDGTTVAANLGLADRFGIKREELIGTNTYDLLDQQAAEYRRKFMDQVIASGKPVRFEDERSGITMENSIYPVLGEHGKVIRLAIFGRDVSERKKAERSLAESEERFRLMIENAPLGYQSLDIDGNFIHINPAWLAILGYEPEEVIGQWFGDFLAPDYRDAFRERFPIFKAAGQIHSEFEMLHKNGSSIFVAFEGRIGYNASGEFKQTHCMLQDITEKRQIEGQIRRSESELKKAQSFAHVGSWVWNIKTGHLEWSDEMHKIFGIPKETFSGNLQEVVSIAIHPDDRQMVEESNLAIATTGKAIPLEYRILHSDGSQRVVWTEAGELEKDAEGNPALLRGIVMDITERKLTEDELREERQRLVGILKGTNAGTWEWNVQTGETIFNDRWAEIIGYTLDEISPISIETWKKYAHPDDLKISGELLERHFCGEIDYYEFESRMKHKDGNWVWVVDRGKVISWVEDGKPLVMMGTHQDITKSKRAEEALQESERRYRERATELETIMDIAPVALWIAQDPSCHVIIGNRAANELHRIKPDQNASLTPGTTQQTPPNQLKIFHDGVEMQTHELPLQICTSKGIDIKDYESQIILEDGTVVHEIGNASPLYDENGQLRGAVGAFMDITGLKQIEEELRRRAEELNALQKTVFDITAAQSLPGLLESIVERACQLVGAHGGGLYLTDPAKKEVHCDVSYKTDVNFVGVVIKYGEGISGRVAQTGEPLYIEDYKNWAGRAQSFDVERPFSAVLGVPLLWGGQVNGVIDVIHYEEGKTFTQADMDMLNIFAGHAAIAIENSRLLEASQAGEDQVRKLSTRLAEAEENERRRIARELHDQVGQSLSALSINMNIMHSQVPEFLPGFKRRLDDSLMLIDQTTDHIRHLMSELRPAVLDDYGLKAALDWAVGSIAKRTNLKFLVEGECNRFPPRIEIALFRIAQEALGNISRHAHARNVKVLLTQAGPEMSMSITDDGVGFDPSNVAATEKSGWGLRLMAERAESIGASLQVESTPGKGTCITARYHDDNYTGG